MPGLGPLPTPTPLWPSPSSLSQVREPSRNQSFEAFDCDDANDGALEATALLVKTKCTNNIGLIQSMIMGATCSLFSCPGQLNR